MKEKPIAYLSGNDPFEWAVIVNWHIIGDEIKFNATVSVGKWTALSADFDQMDDAKMEGCAMMAAMSEELEDMINA